MTEEDNRAIADFNKAIRLNPQDANSYAQRGLIYRRKNDHDRAISDFSEAIRLKPNDANVLRMRGGSSGKKGEHDRMIADLSEVIRLNPKDEQWWSINRDTVFLNGEGDPREIAGAVCSIVLERGAKVR